MTRHKSLKAAIFLLSVSALAILPACSGSQDKPANTVISMPESNIFKAEIRSMASAAGTTMGEFRSGIQEEIAKRVTPEQLLDWRGPGYRNWKADNFQPRFDAELKEIYQYGLAHLGDKSGFNAMLIALHMAEFGKDDNVMHDIQLRLFENYADTTEYAYVLQHLGSGRKTGFRFVDWIKAHPDSKNPVKDMRGDQEKYTMNLMSQLAEKTTNKAVEMQALVSMGTYLGASLDHMNIRDLDAVANRRKRAVGYLETAIAYLKKHPQEVVAAKDVDILATYNKARIAASPPPVPLPPGRVAPEPRPVLNLLQTAENALYIVQGVTVGTFLPKTIGVDLQGNPQDIDQYKGRVLLIDFWATWCGPCIAKFPHFRDMKKTYAGRPFEILGISADDTVEIVHEFLEDNEAPWDMWYSGTRGGVREKWQAYGLPQLFIVDHTGMIRVADPENGELDALIESFVKDAEKAM